MQTLPPHRSVTQLPLPLGEGGAKRRARGTDLAAISIPARDFTGDFYLTHRTGDTLWVTVGDVAGKGLNAAVIMAILQEELEHRLASCATSGCDPAVTMRRLHDLLLPLHSGNRFATIAIAQIRDNGAVRIANAGHPPPLIARAGGRIERIGSTGPAAGILEHSRWTSVYRHLGHGETLLLYTDGAIEANDFGVEGVSTAFRSAASLPTSRSVAEAVADAVKVHGGIEDDLTLLVVRHSER
ncbi:MAG TPA: PP2C family protein-serine/threonine phosphatase [Thermoanaerobaculia bacterium]|nr:PP2C family protein-serine/threonine phosphatase [Thermoanaerobaculia bacterium]